MRPWGRGAAIKTLFLIVALGFAGWFIVANWGATSRAFEGLSPSLVLGAVALAAAGSVTAMLSWRASLADLGTRPQVLDAARIYYASQLGKYIPGSVWQFAALVELGRRQGIPRRDLAVSGIVTLLVSLVTAVTTGFVFLLVFSPDTSRAWGWAALIVLGLAILALHPRTGVLVTNTALSRFGRLPLQRGWTGRGVMAVAGWQTTTWLLWGLHCWLLVIALGVPPREGLVPAMAGFPLAFAAGLAVVLAPAGAGVREGVLGSLLIGVLSLGGVAAAVLCSRVIFTVLDLILCLAAAGLTPIAESGNGMSRSRHAPLRIAIVGPTHPLKGGVAQHSTALAYKLKAAGHQVELVSWLRQYPKRLYPGVQTVKSPEFTPFEPTRRTLSWNNPRSWWREARRLRAFDLVVFAHVTPVQVPPYLFMARLIGRRTERVVICHNVLPHERGRFDRPLTGALLRSATRVLVHSDAERSEAITLTERPIVATRLPPFFPDTFRRRRPVDGEHRRLVFFGLVRPYKGLDVLLRALAQGPRDVSLRVAGEFWGGIEATELLIEELGLRERVEIINGYVDASAVPNLFADVDAMVLPYRSATGSQGVWMAFEFGVPVLTTNAGCLADDVTDGRDGLVVPPDDVGALASAIEQFYEAGTALRLRDHVKPVDPSTYWDPYLDAVLRPS